jgi:Tfp pilus assembly protein PilN
MAQQINLYNPALRLQREWLTLGNVLAAAVCFALALGGVGAYLRSQADARAQAAQLADAELAQARVRLVKAGAAAGMPVAEAELNTLQEVLAARREVLAALQAGSGLSPTATAGFADYLRGLARQSVNGLWLTGFSVAQGGEGMEIRGRMLAAERLPDYIRRLNAERVFAGRQFVSLQVERSVDPDPKRAAVLTPFNSFVLASVRADETKGAAR